MFFTLGFATQIKQDMQVIKYNKKYADSVNMTLELYRQAVGWVPNAADLKGIFNWDSNYREEICRNHGISRSILRQLSLQIIFSNPDLTDYSMNVNLSRVLIVSTRAKMCCMLNVHV